MGRYKLKDTKTIIIEWMIGQLIAGKDIPEEQKTAFRSWLTDDSNAEVKDEALRRVIVKSSTNIFSQYDVDSLSDEAREGWRIIAERLGMNPDIEQHRHIWSKRKALRRQQLVEKALHMSPWKKYAIRAAVLLPFILLVGTLWWYVNLGGDTRKSDNTVAGTMYTPTHNITTRTDSVKYITLNDNTQVILNRNSTLSYNDNREAELSGEAYFKVAKNPAQPFIIHSDKVTVKVLGTEFNFRADAKGSSVLSLYKGAVQLDHAGGKQLLHQAGMEFELDSATGQVDVREFDTSEEPEWVSMEGLYKDYSLGEIFNMIETEYGVEFENVHRIDTTQRISFDLHRGTPLKALLEMLQMASGDFDYIIFEKTVTLKQKK